ncbi:ribosomal protein S18-alanine N-acetyltransferase [Ruminococcus sp. M6(2020)]|uniref:[Ribosomal protein bS18]-alanine N-acetyltransferase n=2 Tax=Ruminococcus difficilis TaxID=2763069 RepID=A0A934WR46_9FIRM|nr:ribosomal protein S18-alanine N-acetyltransferase [Ruminococcus difficilis]
MLPAHLEQVKALLDLCFGDSAWTMESLRSQLDKSDSRCTVAVEYDRIIGFLAFEQVLDEGSIVEVAVHPDCRRKGIARSLITAAIQSAEGLDSIFLEVRESNTSAIRLYESLGFERIGVRKGYYQKPKEDAVIMNLSISVCNAPNP